MKNSIKWFSGAMGAAFGVTFGAMVSAGSWVVETPVKFYEIGEQQSLCFAQCAVSAKAWQDGEQNNVTSVGMDKTDAGGYHLRIKGLKAMSTGELKAAKERGENIKLVGKVE